MAVVRASQPIRPANTSPGSSSTARARATTPGPGSKPRPAEAQVDLHDDSQRHVGGARRTPKRTHVVRVVDGHDDVGDPPQRRQAGRSLAGPDDLVGDEDVRDA